MHVAPHHQNDITLGLGPKTMGAIGGLDNGFARFDHYRIPRSRMLSKFAQVTKEGKYVRPPHAKISYGGVCQILPISEFCEVLTLY